MTYSQINIVYDSLRELIPLNTSETHKRKTITVTDWATDKSYYQEIHNKYGVSLIRDHYGLNRYLSNLYMYTTGFNRRTLFYFIENIFSVYKVYPVLSKFLYASHMSYLRKKFNEHTY
jgi:hypothetical protein